MSGRSAVSASWLAPALPSSALSTKLFVGGVARRPARGPSRPRPSSPSRAAELDRPRLERLAEAARTRPCASPSVWTASAATATGTSVSRRDEIHRHEEPRAPAAVRIREHHARLAERVCSPTSEPTYATRPSAWSFQFRRAHRDRLAEPHRVQDPSGRSSISAHTVERSATTKIVASSFTASPSDTCFSITTPSIGVRMS